MTSAAYAQEASNSFRRQAPLDFAHQVDLYAANQLHRLEKQISRRLTELSRTEEKLSQLETELSTFSNSYFAEVGPLCDEISQLEEALAIAMPHASRYAKQMRQRKDAAIASREETNTQVRKALYRRLVKETHPDTQADSQTARFMRIQEAYETGSLAALWQVEWEAVQCETRHLEPTERMQRLLRWFQELERYGQALGENYLRQKTSDTAQLMGRYMEARLAGRDWMGQMKQQLQTQAEQLKQTLVNQKLQKLVLEAR